MLLLVSLSTVLPNRVTNCYRSIRTYQGRGVRSLPSRLRKEEHSIAWVDPKNASADLSEISATDKDHETMQDDIRITKTITDASDQLHPMARILWTQLYTISHNVKASPFGNVHPDYAHVVVDAFNETNGMPTINVEPPTDVCLPRASPTTARTESQPLAFRNAPSLGKPKLR